MQAIYHQVAEVRYGVAQNSYSPSDKTRLNKMVEQVEQALHPQSDPLQRSTQE